MKHYIKTILKLIQLLCLVIFTKSSIGIEQNQAKALCTPTKKVKTAAKPITYDPTYTDNNTTKNSGEFDNIYQNKILIRGVIKDKGCVPVRNASIEIWQDDEYGKKRYNQFSYSFSNRYRLNKEQYSNFLGIAAATSDNNGYFSFISVIPNSKLKLAKESLVNISVSHVNFPILETQVVLNPKFPIKKSNRKIIAFRNLAQKQMHSLPTYDIEIILDGKNKYKTY